MSSAGERSELGNGGGRWRLFLSPWCWCCRARRHRYWLLSATLRQPLCDQLFAPRRHAPRKRLHRRAPGGCLTGPNERARGSWLAEVPPSRATPGAAATRPQPEALAHRRTPAPAPRRHSPPQAGTSHGARQAAGRQPRCPGTAGRQSVSSASRAWAGLLGGNHDRSAWVPWCRLGGSGGEPERGGAARRWP